MAEVRFRIEPKSNNPYMKGIAFIIAAVALSFPFVFAVLVNILAHHDVCHPSERFCTIVFSLYAGLVTIGFVRILCKNEYGECQ